MEMIDVFKSDAFSLVSLLGAIRKIPFKPERLGQLGIFKGTGKLTTVVAVEEKGGTLSLIPVSERHAPLDEHKTEKRKMRNFDCARIARGSTITAEELQNLRAFGSENQLASVQAEVAERLAGPTGLMQQIELTWEHMRLGAIQGKFIDSDGSTIIDYFSEFNITPNAEVKLDLANANPASGVLRKQVTGIVRTVLRKLETGGTNVKIHALCGDAFWDDLIAHPEVRQTFLNTQSASDLRGGAAFGSFSFGGVEWENYRGTDDGSTVAIPTDLAKLFPIGAPGVFQTAWGPAEFLNTINRKGRPLTPLVIPDRERNSHVRVELYSYPLFINTRPATLVSASRLA